MRRGPVPASHRRDTWMAVPMPGPSCRHRGASSAGRARIDCSHPIQSGHRRFLASGRHAIWWLNYTKNQKRLDAPNICRHTTSLRCPSGGIGRRRGLKILRRKACRFESDLGHQRKINRLQVWSKSGHFRNQVTFPQFLPCGCDFVPTPVPGVVLRHGDRAMPQLLLSLPDIAR